MGSSLGLLLRVKQGKQKAIFSHIVKIGVGCKGLIYLAGGIGWSWF